MEVKQRSQAIYQKVKIGVSKFRENFVEKNEFSQKLDLKFKTFKVIGLIGVLVFVAVVFLMPTDIPIEFTERIDRPDPNASQDKAAGDPNQASSSAQGLWGAPKMPTSQGGEASQVNYNTSMVIGSKGGNAKTELRAGIRLPLRILDKVIVSQDSVPILAELILDSQTDSGLKLAAGTRFYGEASFQKGSDRATIRFTQISLPSGQIKKVSALALSKDGQPGVPGRVFSDGMKNTAGQVLTTFVGGLAAGSMETDILGRSKGGIENGLLGAVAATAQSRAQNYGEKLKTEREWIELNPGVECDAILSDALKLQEGGDTYE